MNSYSGHLMQILAEEALKCHHQHRDRDQTVLTHTSPNNTQRNINMAILAECYGEMIHGDSTYFISNMEHVHEFLSLVDRGANGGICGDDMTLISYTRRTIDVQDIDNHELPQLKLLCSCSGVVCTQWGPAILYLINMPSTVKVNPSTRHFNWRITSLSTRDTSH